MTEQILGLWLICAAALGLVLTAFLGEYLHRVEIFLLDQRFAAAADRVAEAIKIDLALLQEASRP